MTVLSLKTELDLAELLLNEGWCPGEINGILVFPLPRAAFFQLGSHYGQITDSDVIKATAATPTTLYRARQLLASAGWLERELDSLLKPYLYSLDPWANQTIHTRAAGYQGLSTMLRSGAKTGPLPTLNHYRRAMALKRIVSLALVIMLVSITVVILG